ncbi:endolysin [Escherichia phage F13]|uniref:Lytic enzyme n=1 Tax=Escherichia phage vB_EcoM_SP13 TaxID=2981577 RepID=A0A9X9JTH5_9CAUD|nr:lytic enzyme [Escherichia phage vB_EcoM_SP13]WAQ79371.1 endolysin [Escherichia phage F13]
MINANVISKGTGCSMDVAEKWVDPFKQACEHYGIKSKNAIAALLANVGVETGSMKTFVENLNYSAQGLANTWPSRYSASGRFGGAPNSLALSIARKPMEIANNTYANRMGNGSVASGDGWKYRGRGAIQLTGKANYAEYSKQSGYDALNNPDILTEPKHIADSAAWFFKNSGCIPLADAGAFDSTVKRINGAAPNTANHGDLRRKRYKDALAVM